MKKLKTMTLLLFICIGLQVTAQKNSSLSKEDVKTELIEGFAKFVESVRPFYQKGDTFQEFKHKVFYGYTASKNTRPTPVLPTEGDAMLKKAYDYLSIGYNYSQMVNIGDYETMGNAVLFYDTEQKKVGSNAKKSDIEATLFGGDSTRLNSNPMLANRGGCRWWQLSCHLDSIFGNDGGAAILDTIITIIIEILEGIFINN
jgi:hypothetical protein